jgi:CheY-like chemotaxis protein
MKRPPLQVPIAVRVGSGIGLRWYGATAEIRRREGGDAHVPIIAMTANTMSEDRERCLAAGMGDYVGKPVRPDTLDEVIARLLS